LTLQLFTKDQRLTSKIAAKEKLTGQFAYLVKNNVSLLSHIHCCQAPDQQIHYMGMQVFQGLHVRVKGSQGK
jgi:hypothetical protein